MEIREISIARGHHITLKTNLSLPQQPVALVIFSRP